MMDNTLKDELKLACQAQGKWAGLPLHVYELLLDCWKSESKNASLQQRVEALERFVRAHDALEEGIANLELHNSTAQELWAARKAIGLIAAAQEGEEHTDE